MNKGDGIDKPSECAIMISHTCIDLQLRVGLWQEEYALTGNVILIFVGQSVPPVKCWCNITIPIYKSPHTCACTECTKHMLATQPPTSMPHGSIVIFSMVCKQEADYVHLPPAQPSLHTLHTCDWLMKWTPVFCWPLLGAKHECYMTIAQHFRLYNLFVSFLFVSYVERKWWVGLTKLSNGFVNCLIIAYLVTGKEDVMKLKSSRLSPFLFV